MAAGRPEPAPPATSTTPALQVRAGVAEQVLDVEFAGVLLDGPGREGMAKAVGVAAGYVGGASAAAEQLLEAVGLEPHAGPQPAGPGDGP